MCTSLLMHGVTCVTYSTCMRNAYYERAPRRPAAARRAR
eukprot:COSAG01_NODE_957_length_12474_cov_44.298182_21_plen_38_part_01